MGLGWMALVQSWRSLPTNNSTTRQDYRATLLVAVALLVMQGCTIALFARMNVGYALAMFQIGSLISVLLGHRLFGEGHLLRRMGAALIMVAGAVIIIVAG